MTEVKSYLGRHQPMPAKTIEDRRKAAREFWNLPMENEDDRWLCVRLGDIKTWPDRQWAINLGNDQYLEGNKK